MEEELRYIEGLVGEIKAELFSSTADLCSLLLPPSAYHTAWVAMVPDPEHLDRPMFSECLDWILDNQKMYTDGGFWGSNQGPTIHCLADTIACLVALKTWKVDSSKIEQGIWFLHSNMEKMLMSTKLDGHSTILLAGMIELAQDRGLEVLPPDGNKEMMNNLILQRDRLLETTEHCGTNDFDLGMFIEVLPANYMTKHAQTEREKLDRSNFRLPSVAAYSFMTTGDNNCIEYLRNVVQRWRDGAVHPLYPMEEELIKLILVDHLERLGCGKYFELEISDIIKIAYRNWMEENHDLGKHDVRLHIYQSSLTFRILRSHGYNVSPGRFCGFVYNKDILLHMENEYIYYIEAMYELYRASHFMFHEENDLEKAKYFSRKLLQKWLLCDKSSNGSTMINNFKEEIEHELKVSWLARMDHLEHRRYIEYNRGYALRLGNALFFRLSFPNKINELAKRNFMLRQLVYRDELEELKRWSKDTRLSNMGFGREKTTYCYFLSYVATNLPLSSDMRKILAKCGILVTVADDFFDEKGLMDELHNLTEAIKRWEGKDLSGHSKVIFDAINEHVIDVTSKRFNQRYHPMEMNLQEIKEVEDGKLNIVLLYAKEIQDANIEESIKYIKNILETSKELLLELILKDDYIALPKEWKGIHLSILKGFYMLFNDGNGYDSPTALLSDIHNALYNPLEMEDTYSGNNEVKKYTSKKNHTYPSRGNESRNFMPIQTKSKEGFRYSAGYYSRPTEFKSMRTLNNIKFRRFPIIDYRTTSIFSKKPLIISKLLYSVPVPLFI